jgi:hypothetical protein
MLKEKEKVQRQRQRQIKREYPKREVLLNFYNNKKEIKGKIDLINL